MVHAEFLRTHPVFTVAEFAAHLATRPPVGDRAAASILSYYRRTGRIVRVRRGLCAVVPPGGHPETFPVDPYLIAAKLAGDAVLSHHTALEFHGRAYSVHESFIYSASRPPEPLTFRAYTFRGIPFPRALVRAGKMLFGVTTAERRGVDLRVTNLERTLVDVLNRPDFSGGWEEIWRSLASVEYYDLDQVVEYALLLGNATTAAKVGFFLDEHHDVLRVHDHHLAALRARRPRQPHYLERSRRLPGRLVADWNLIVPEDVLERAWEEVR